MRLTLFEKIILEVENKPVEFTADEILHKERIEKILEIRIKNLSYPDYDLYKKVKEIYPNITYYNFCKDINYVERIIANQIDPTGDPHKVFLRYFITEITKKAIKIAENRGESYNMAYAANILGKHNQTDKEDTVKPPFDQIVPPVFEFTHDPRILGIEPVENLEQRKIQLAEKYGIKLNKLDFIEEVKNIKILEDGK